MDEFIAGSSLEVADLANDILKESIREIESIENSTPNPLLSASLQYSLLQALYLQANVLTHSLVDIRDSIDHLAKVIAANKDTKI